MNRYRFLIGESDKAMAENIVLMLQHAFEGNVEVRFANSVRNVIDEVAVWQPDIIFMKHDLPDGGLVKLLSLLNDELYRLIILVENSEMAIEPIKLSGFHYLVKPFDLDELLDNVDELLGFTSLNEYLYKRDVLLNNASSKSDLQMYLYNDEEIRVIDLDQIISFHSVVGGAELSLKDADAFQITLPIRRFEDVLKQNGFIRCGCSLINMGEILSVDIQNKELNMSNGEPIKLANRVFDQFIQFYNS